MYVWIKQFDFKKKSKNWSLAIKVFTLFFSHPNALKHLIRFKDIKTFNNHELQNTGENNLTSLQRLYNFLARYNAEYQSNLDF